MAEDRFSYDIQRIQAEQIGVQQVDAPSKRKVEESLFRSEFLQQLGLTDTEEEKKLKFSKHAIDRIRKRNLKIDKAELSSINDSIEKARSKNVKETLVLLDNIALIVSIDSNTVITAMDKNSMKEKVITNIDSAVLG